MNKLFITLSLFLVTTCGLFGQLSQGIVSYEMNFSSDNPDNAMALAMMGGSKMSLYFQGNNTRAEVSMGTMMNMVTVTNLEEMMMLMDVPMAGMKYAVHSTMEELKEMGDSEEAEVEVKLENETKEILGYNCKKAIAIDEDGNETTFWYTEDIVVNKEGQNYLNSDIPGFPLEYEILQGDMIVNMKAIEFIDELNKKEAKVLFDMSTPEGYEEKTMEEIQNMGM